MKQSQFEPGLLPVFRLFLGVRIVLSWLRMCLWLIFPDERSNLPMIGLIEATFLILYLSWNWLRSKMGWFYLPVALFLATVGPIAEFAMTIAYRITKGVAPGALLDSAWLLVVILFIPLILVSWQYKWWMGPVYSIGIVLVELLSLIPLVYSAGGRFGDFRPIITLSIAQIMLFIPVGYVVFRLVSAQRIQRNTLADANTQLARYATTLEQLAISRERNRIARELHDTLAHTLSGLAVQLEAIKAVWETDTGQAREMLDQSLIGTRQGLQDARRAIQALRATPLEDMGLALAIWNLAESYRARLGVSLDLDVPAQIDDLGPEVEQAVYRIAEEALANIARHAGASRLTVRLTPENGSLNLAISDNGCGFNIEDIPEGHFGLKGIAERAEMIGGILDIKSQPGQGTTICLTVERST